MNRRHELTDEQWLQISPLLSGRKDDPGRTGEDNRQFSMRRVTTRYDKTNPNDAG